MMIAISVTGKDRPGIIAALSGAILKSGGNLEDASMTVLEGEFAMIFLASLKGEAHLRRLERKLNDIMRNYRLSVGIREVKHRLIRGEKHRKGTDPWVISVLGKDRSGIVYHVCRLLASAGLNITDLNSKIMGKGPKATYALMLEVDVPRKHTLIAKLKKRLDALQARLRVSINFHPLETAYL